MKGLVNLRIHNMFQSRVNEKLKADGKRQKSIYPNVNAVHDEAKQELESLTPFELIQEIFQ